MLEAESIATATAEAARSNTSVDRLVEWARINSGSTNTIGLNRMAAVFADELSDLPGPVKEMAGGSYILIDAAGNAKESETGKHLRCDVRPDAPIQMLFTGHMDTVFGLDHGFQDCRLVGVDGVLNGPGVADMKGGIQVLLAALKALEEMGALGPLGYTVILNSDEEIGSPTSSTLIEEAARGKQAAFTFEPALPDGHLVCSRPGNGNFSILVEGKSAHAGRNISDGRNAVAAAAQLGLRLVETLGQRFPVNLARIDGGAPFNTVPDRAVLRLNIRPPTVEDMAVAQQALAKLIDEISHSCGVTVSPHGGFGRPPKPLDAQTLRLLELVRDSAQSLGIDIGWRPSGGVCDGNNIAHLGVPVVDTMGVVGGDIHTCDEFMICSSLAERAALAAVAMHRIAQGALR